MASSNAAGPVTIAQYDPRWPSLYEVEKARILAAIGPCVVDIQHVGSTAIPGLAAKPIIDITIGLRRLADGEACIGPLEAIGYEYRGEAGIPGRLFFRKPTPRPAKGQTLGLIIRGVARSHHLHLVEHGSDFWVRHLLFRDYLRDHPDVARQYEELKKELAAKFGTDHEGYTEAKSDFIQSIEAKARAKSNVGRGLQTPT